MLAEKAKGYEAASYKGLFHFVRYIEKLKKYDQDFGEASVEESQKGWLLYTSGERSGKIRQRPSSSARGETRGRR